MYCRYCDSGEGVYTVKTIYGEAIYQRVHQASLAIADVLERVNMRIPHSYQQDHVHVRTIHLIRLPSLPPNSLL